MSFLECGGAVHHYVWRSGLASGAERAPVVVFINALGTDLRIWEDVALALPPSWSVLRYDLRGQGGTELGDRPVTIERLAADLEALLEGLGLTRVIVCGLSLGGLVAQQLALRAPRRVAGLCLCGTASRIGTRESWEERIRQVREGGLAAISTGVLARWFTARFREQEEAVCRGFRTLLERACPRGYLAGVEALRDADLTSRVSSIAAPALVLSADEDSATPSELGRGLSAAIPGARFQLLHEASHLMCVERPSAVSAALVELALSLDATGGGARAADASRQAAGERVRRAVLGDAHVERAARAATDFDRDFQELITRAVWGEVWGRPGLPLATRHLVTIALLAALNRQEELALHVGATCNTGVSPQQVKEVLMHVGAYAGVPAAHAALRTAKRALYGET